MTARALSMVGGPGHGLVVNFRTAPVQVIGQRPVQWDAHPLTTSTVAGPRFTYTPRTLVWPPERPADALPGERAEGPSYVREFLVWDGLPEADLVDLATALDLTERGCL